MTYIDPRGVRRRVIKVEEPTVQCGRCFVTFACGHRTELAAHFHYTVGDVMHCFACGQIAIPEDLSIPAFLRTSAAGTPHQATQATCCDISRHEMSCPPGYGASCWQEMTREDSDVRQAAELRCALRQYEEEKRLAAFQQWAAENPELAAMNRKAKRDANRRIAKLGIPPATRRSR